MSSTSLIMERSHLEVGFVPVADAWDTTNGTTDIVNMNKHNRVRFILFWGVGATGTFTPVVEACDDVAASNVTAIAYKYRITTAAAGPGAVLSATAVGVLSTAGSNQILEIEVDAAAVGATGYGFVRVKCTEGTNSPILGGCLIEMLEPQHAGLTQPAAIV